MMDLYLEVVTPEEILFNGTIGLVDVPGSAGRFTVLRDHGPIMSTLTAGVIRVISKEGTEHHFKCREGFLECYNNHVTILMDHPIKDADL